MTPWNACSGVITKEWSSDIVILDMPILDSRQGNDLIGTVISDIVLQLLSYVAETERAFIRQRQAEDIRTAMASGVSFGMERMARLFNLIFYKNSGAVKPLGIKHSTFRH